MTSPIAPKGWITFGVRALRPRIALPVFALLVALYFVVLHPWLISWGATPTEQQIVLPGDEFVPNPAAQSTRAITINAPADAVWSWLIQLGQDRGGFYSYDWLENLFGMDIHTTNVIRPAWQQRATGETVPLMPSGYLGITGEKRGPQAISEPGRSLALKGWGVFVIQPVNDRTTRLIVRERASSANVLTRLIMDPVYFTMERQTLSGIKARAEGRPNAPAILEIPARIGWAVAGKVVIALFVIERRRLPWLALPIAATIPAIAFGHDMNAALAAFLAVGITILGALIFGRQWWGPFLLLGSAVMLTLLLTPDAYLAIGWAFALLVLGGITLLLTRRPEVGIRRRSIRPAI